MLIFNHYDFSLSAKMAVSIYKLMKEGKIVGRNKLADMTKGTKYEMTKYQMRNRLEKLENLELIIKSKGKRGTSLTNKGKKYLMAIMGDKVI